MGPVKIEEIKKNSLIQDYKKVKILEKEYYILCKKYESYANFESAPVLTKIQSELAKLHIK